MKTLLTILLMTIFTSTFGQSDQELKYLKTRNNSIDYFKNILSSTHSESDWSKLDRKMDSSFVNLEIMLRDIMKFAQIREISKTGKISLGSLLEGDLGFGNLDGLELNTDSLHIFVTSKYLFKEYFKEAGLNSIENLTNKQLDNILTSALGGGEARVETLFAEKKSSTKNYTVYKSIGGFGQESLPIMGKCVFVITLKEDYVYIIWKFNSIAELHVCKSIYDKILLDSEKYIEKYHASNLKDTASLNKGFALQDEAQVKYCECYQKNLKGDKQFENVEKQFKKIEQYIEQ